MNTSNQQFDAKNSHQEEDISLIDIIKFLAGIWKKLLIAAVVGAFLGLAGWLLLGSYSAEFILLNNSNSNSNSNSNNSYALDIVSWKTIQKSLPNLAAQVLAEGTAPEGSDALYRSMSNDKWWLKNISPSYAISKADTKDLAGISKDLDAASTTILSLTVTSEGNTKESSIDNVRAAARFLRTGGAYLQTRNILNAYEAETISTVADIQKKITTTQIEMSYQQERARQLEELGARFPANGALNRQVIDIKDSGAKYLPISTQIIAVKNDINQSKEQLTRSRDRLEQIKIIKKFLDEANPLVEKKFDGLALNAELLEVEGKLRDTISENDITSLEILDQLRAQLLQISARFTKGLEANTAPTSKKAGVIKSIAGGMFAAFLLMLLALLGQRVWLKVKNNSPNSF